MRAALEVSALRVRVSERLEVRDPRRAEAGFLRRGEAEEQLGGVWDEVGARNAGRERHSLRQAHAALEPAAREADPHARGLEKVEGEQSLGSVRDRVLVVAPQQEGDVVRLEDDVARVAGKADRMGQRLDRVPFGAGRTQVDRDMRGGLVRDEAVEVREAPGGGDADSRRGRLPSVLDRGERALELLWADASDALSPSTLSFAVTIRWWSGGTMTSIPSSWTTRTPSSTCCSVGKPAADARDGVRPSRSTSSYSAPPATAPAAAPASSSRRVRRGTRRAEPARGSASSCSGSAGRAGIRTAARRARSRCRGSRSGATRTGGATGRRRG